MDKHPRYRSALVASVVVALAALGAACSDDGDDAGGPCEAAQDLKASMSDLGDADRDDLDEASEQVADDFESFRDSVRDATREEVTDLGDSITDLRDAVGSDDGDVGEAVDGVDEAWGALVDEIESNVADCDLSS
jgi:hypothetical protein